ncbi:Annexin, partial [Cynara cardunculus var. scolymus]
GLVLSKLKANIAIITHTCNSTIREKTSLQFQSSRERRLLPTMATLTIPPVLSSPRDDAMHLYKAFKGLGCDTSAVINILAHRDSAQRALIANEYKVMYSEDLTKRLSSELSGNVKKAVLLWMPDPARRDAIILRDALTTDIDLKAATEVICSRTPTQLQHLKQLYHALHGTYLEHAIQAQASGDLEQLLLAYLSTPRSEGFEVDRTMVDHDAKALYKAGEKRLGTDEKTFRVIFSGRSRAHLAAVSSAYHSMYGRELKKVVKSETSGNFEHALVTILQCAENPGKYFAKVSFICIQNLFCFAYSLSYLVLRKAMKGIGTADKTLIRKAPTMATLTIPPVLSSPRDDAMHLYKAFKGLGCDTSAVVNILAHRDSAQRALIIHDYKIMYSEDPIKRLTSELGGDLKKAILLWMPDPARRDAIILQDALTTDIDLKAATEVICSRTPSQLQHLKQIYPSLHGVYKHLEDAIQAQTSGDLGQLLLAYLSTPRSEGLEVDRTMVDHDAKALYKAGEKRLGTDEKTFRIIFSGRSRAHLAAVSSAYHNMYGNTLKKAVKGETSGNYEHALVTILQCTA